MSQVIDVVKKMNFNSASISTQYFLIFLQTLQSSQHVTHYTLATVHFKASLMLCITRVSSCNGGACDLIYVVVLLLELQLILFENLLILMNLNDMVSYVLVIYQSLD